MKFKSKNTDTKEKKIPIAEKNLGKQTKNTGGFKKIFANKKTKKNTVDTNQNDIDLFNNQVKEKDIFTPSCIQEVDMKDGKDSKYNYDNYMVEVGTGIGTTRWYRNFFGRMVAENTYFGMFNDLIMGNFGAADCDIAIHKNRADDGKTRFLLDRKIAGLEADLLNAEDSIKIKKLKDQLKELHGREERLRKNIEQLFNVSIQATVSDNNLESVKKYSNNMIKRMANRGVFFKSADTKQLPALLSLTPYENTKKEFSHTFKSVESSNLADMMPFGFGTISHRSGLIIGENPFKKPVFFDSRHPNLINYNSIILGESGSGKSMCRKIIQGRRTLQGVMGTFIDYELENKEWIERLGFPYIELADTSSDYGLNIFPIPRIVVDRRGTRKADIDDAVNTVSAVVFKMLNVINDKNIQGYKKILIKECIQRCYKEKGITYEADSIYKDSNISSSGLITTKKQFKQVPQLQDLYEIMGINEFKTDLEEERRIIKSFTEAGTIKSQAIFDRQSNVNFSSNTLIGVSVNGLDEIMKPIALYNCTSNCWSSYERLPKSIQKDIIIDEAQNMMLQDEMATWLENRYRISRRRNTGIHAITQGFEVFLRKEQGLGILKNASTKFLFRQSKLDIDSIEGKFNLPQGAKEKLLNFQAGECIMIVGDEMEILKTKPTPTEYELFNTNPNEVEEGII